MKKLTYLMCALSLALGLGQLANAQANSDKVVTVELSQAYIPQGFDNNDVTKVVVEGFFPNTCYKVKKQEAADVKIDQDKKLIQVSQKAYVYNQMCLMMIVPFSETVEVGKIADAGEYKLTDSLSSRELGRMSVATSKTIGPDDFFYAMVQDAYVDTSENNELVVVIKGELPGNCWELTEKRIFQDGKNVLTVLPIVEQTSSEYCTVKRVPFTTTVPVPTMNAGRYLLNVRSLNGQAVNKLFDVPGSELAK